jgi:acetolactate synthase-1/2/3 large subunit
VRQVGFQETDIVSMSKPITKFSYKLKDPKEIRYILEKSHHIAISGRPGPVLIDIPMDLQRCKINPTKLKSFQPKKQKKTKLSAKTNYVINEIKKSKKPVIILGGGVKYAGAEDKLKSFLKKLNIPIVTTWSGVDLIDHDQNKYIGNIGVYGSRAANFAIQNSDLFLSLGSRLDTRITGGVPKNFARKAKKIMVDIDKNELNKKRGLNIDYKIHENVKSFLEKISSSLKLKISKQEWLDKCIEWKKKYPIVDKKYYNDKKYVNPYVFIEFLSKKLSKKETIIADDGGHLTWTLQAFKIKYGQKLFSAFGNSPMGYSLPASIGASIAKGNSRIFCIDGDGSIQINIQELHTINKLKLPIKIFMLNNNGYGIIKQFQELYLGKRFEASGKGVSNPNFEKISKAFNIKYNIIKNHNDLIKLEKIIKSKNAEFVEVMLKPTQKIIPKLQFGNPIEDMSPLLPRKEFYQNMDVKIIKRDKKIFEAN